MSDVATIERKIDELDTRFESVNNKSSGLLTVTAYYQQRGELERKLTAAKAQPSESPSGAKFVKLEKLTRVVKLVIAMFNEGDGKLSTKISDLEKRVGNLEQRAPVSYAGVYEPSREYRRGEMVTFAGSIFHCEVDRTMDRPETSAAWKLAVKRGRDGRDAQ